MMASRTAAALLLQLALFFLGLAMAASPWFVEGGVFGWWQEVKVRPETDILGIQTLGKYLLGFVSIGAGLLLCNVAGLTSIVIGLAAAARGRVSPPVAPPPVAPTIDAASTSAADDRKDRSPPADHPSIGEGI